MDPGLISQAQSWLPPTSLPQPFPGKNTSPFLNSRAVMFNLKFWLPMHLSFLAVVSVTKSMDISWWFGSVQVAEDPYWVSLPGFLDDHTWVVPLACPVFLLGSLDCSSFPLPSNVEVPQATILGPLLSSPSAFPDEAFSAICKDSVIILTSLKPVPPAHQFSGTQLPHVPINCDDPQVPHTFI